MTSCNNTPTYNKKANALYAGKHTGRCRGEERFLRGYGLATIPRRSMIAVTKNNCKCYSGGHPPLPPLFFLRFLKIP